MKLAANLIESYIIYSLCASYWFFYRLQYNEGGQSLFKCEAKFAVQTFNAQKIDMFKLHFIFDRICGIVEPKFISDFTRVLGPVL